ncbi:MAG: ATP-binding protein [Pseudomonadota bacterium]
MTPQDSTEIQAPAAQPNDAEVKPSKGPSIGRIVHVSGAKARVLLNQDYAPELTNDDSVPFIGTLLAVDTGHAIALGLITEMAVPNPVIENERLEPRFVDVELVGELIRHPDGYLSTFRRGVSVYPRLGDRVQNATQEMLKKVYQFGNFDSVMVGQLHQDPTIPAVIKVDDMLGKHFAIVGSTGSGKSCAVALVLQKVLEKHANAHVVLLDPHNEYGDCFGDQTEKVKITDLNLPYWLLTFEEAVEILIRDAARHSDEVEILREIIPAAKRQYASGGNGSLLRSTATGLERFTVDMPVPYRISDVLELINIEMGRLEKRKDISTYQRLKARIETIIQDPRFAFMFGSMSVQDNFASILKRLFRVPVAGKPITVMQLMGLPSEVVNVVVSVMSRLAFDIAMWSEGKIAITFVCEEAHRYVPRSEDQGFEPTKRAISRIAKEGRKYGCSLCIVSQRPGDVDPTILSQCSTIFTMRLSNERDQGIIEAALSDSSASLMSFLPALGTRETIVFGEGVPLPSRILLAEIPQAALPRGGMLKFADAWGADNTNSGQLESMIARWRLSTEVTNTDQFANSGTQPCLPGSVVSQPPQPAPGERSGSVEDAVSSGMLWADTPLQQTARSIDPVPVAPTHDAAYGAHPSDPTIGRRPSDMMPVDQTPPPAPDNRRDENWRAEMLQRIAGQS